MLKANPISINHPDVPKPLRNKAKLVRKLWKNFNVIKLREVRDSSKSAEINIYHHSFGTDSYYHDLEGKIYTWEQIQESTNIKMDAGLVVMTVVMPYRAGIVFYKSSIAPHPSLN